MPQPENPPVASVVPWKQCARLGCPPSGGKPLTSARAPCRKHLAPALGGHARAETVTTLAYKLARLIGPLHDEFSGGRAVAIRASRLPPRSAKKTRIRSDRHAICAAYKGGARARQCDPRASAPGLLCAGHKGSQGGEIGPLGPQARLSRVYSAHVRDPA